MRKMSFYELSKEAEKAKRTPLAFLKEGITQDTIVLLSRLREPILSMIIGDSTKEETEELQNYHDEVRKLLMEILYLGGVPRK